MSNYVSGIDTSFYQDKEETPEPPDFQKAYNAGARFSFHRGGQGIWYDPDFKVNWANAKKAGLLRAVYWFYDYRFPANAQAEKTWFLENVDKGELPAIIDLERVPILENGVRKYVPLPPTKNLYIALDQFIDILSGYEGRCPILYTNLDFLWYIITQPTEKMKKCPLWVACYNPTPPVRLGAWKEWKFWQYSSHGDGPAYGMESGNVDLDYFNGTIADLRAFAGAPTPPKSWGWAVTDALRDQGYTIPDPKE